MPHDNASRKATLRPLRLCGLHGMSFSFTAEAQRLRRVSRMNLAFLYTGGGGWIVAVVTPGGMVEVKHKVTIIGDHGVIKSQPANTPPITEADGCGKFTVT